MKRFVFAILLFVFAIPAMATEYSVSYMYRKVVSVEEIHDIVVDRIPIESERYYCSEEGDVGGTIVGGIIGGLAGNALTRGRGRGLGTVLGAGSGMYIGNRLTTREHCGRSYVRSGYTEVEREVIRGYIITLDNNETFRSDRRYRIGDKVRVRVTYQ